ncbi:C39 family peptidase [Methanoregula sp.]|uniref:C39 family peptidase n=1 Tax=Methanoregula sp. TaxID=2052170 RepID=UPI00236DC457|nr:C39 family peptidase [Methanoregula sp.]MDD1687460.1 C39 family peptidase [Methanoregula sp.]
MKRPGPAILAILLIIVAFALLGIAQYAISTPRPGSGNITYALDTPLPEPRYYTGIDFDTLKSNDHLTVIPLKSFRQQVSNYTCGPVAAMTVLSYYGMPANNTDADEARIAREMGTSANGTNPEQIASWFNRNGWNATWGTGGSGQMLRDNLKAGIPTMVEWIDWGGHWVVVVGYDTRGTETVWDDVIICADSVDSHDDRVDGITYANYGEFDAMWFDAHYFPEHMQNRAYVVAVPA